MASKVSRKKIAKRDMKIVEMVKTHTHKEVAKKFKVSQSRVAQIIHKENQKAEPLKQLVKNVMEASSNGYNYAQERADIFTDQGQQLFLFVRDTAKKIVKKNGAFRINEIIENYFGLWPENGVLASLDRMVELKELKEITSGVDNLERVFVYNVQESTL